MLIGVVGKPSVGKSTFFKAATLAEVEIASYPFTTIKPNSGVGYVKINCLDTELNVKCNPREGYCTDGKRFVPVQLLDVAGLVPGAHEGKGMGNQFLDDLNQADVLIQVVDVSGSTNEKGESVEPLSYEPANEIRFLEEELDMWYLRLIKKGWERFARQVNQERPQLNKAVAKQLSSARVTEGIMEEAIRALKLPEDIMKWDDAVLKRLATYLRKMTKPMIVACNKIDVNGADKNFEKLKGGFSDYMLMPCSAESELALREAAKHKLIDYIPGENDFKILKEDKLNEKQKKALEFVKKNVLEKYGSTGVQKVLDKAVFDLLKRIAVYPVENETKLTDSKNNILPDIYLLEEKSTALDLAFKIHTDIGNKFNSAIDARTKKRLGKGYFLKNRDVIRIF